MFPGATGSWEFSPRKYKLHGEGRSLADSPERESFLVEGASEILTPRRLVRGFSPIDVPHSCPYKYISYIIKNAWIGESLNMLK